MSKPKHHIRQEVCSTRAPYRDGRRPTAVKVYTIHHEARHVIVQGVPTVGASSELVKLFETVGDVEEHKVLDDYPGDQFTEVHLIKYKRIQSARFAKRKLDDWSFYGGVLHVCYAPEFETVQETREKLRERRRVVEAKTRQYRSDGTYSGSFSESSKSSSTQDDSGKKDQHQQKLQNFYVDITEETDINYGDESTRNKQNFDGTTAHSHNTGTQFQQTSVYSGSNDERYQYQSGGSELNPPNVENYNMYAPVLNFPQHTSGENLDGNIELYGRKVQQNRSSCYAEQVLQQARSLQNYGKSTLLTNEIRAKRPNSDSATNKGHEADQSTCTTNETEDIEEELLLPPPPKQSKFSHVSSKKSQVYGGAKVPSAQATFPVDFDARTDRRKVLADCTMVKEPVGLESGLDQKGVNEELRVDKIKIIAKTMQEKVEENLKNKNVIIKDCSKKGTIPKFIPRQAQIKLKLNKTSEGNKPSGVANKTDELNLQIRKNAFKLGKAQGPADLGPSKSNESLDSKEKSVIHSMLEIRKKLTKVKH